MTSAEFRELALMTAEDFDGRLYTYAIGIKLALGPNLQNLQSQCPDRAPGADPRISVLGVKTARRRRIYKRKTN